MRRIGVLNGPNLNLLGTRQPEIYGSTSYEELRRRIEEKASALGVAVDVFQSNHEGELIDRVQEWSRDPALSGVVVNPGGLTHTSVALRDALLLLPCPVVEVHLSNVAAREGFRRRSLVSGVARGVISGLGVEGYLAAVEYLAGGSAPGCPP
jgi:3-dehydroquinate dehydratase-2